MTAAGSSATDALHHMYDRAAYALGYGESSDEPQEGGDDAASGSGTSRSSSDDPNRPVGGPGNHPSNRAKRGQRRYRDHNHSEYKPELTEPEETDTRIDEENVSAGRARHEHQDEATNASASRTGDALERALAVDGPVGQRMGAPLDRELQKDAMARKARERGIDKDEIELAGDDEASRKSNKERRSNVLQNSTVVASGAADIGEPMQSERNMPKPHKAVKERLKKLRPGAKADSDDDTSIDYEQDGPADDEHDSIHEEEAIQAGRQQVTEQNPNQKGPAWASRPNDEQREKLRKLHEEQRRRKSASKRGALRGWASSKRGKGDRTGESTDSSDDATEERQEEADEEALHAEAEQAAASGKSLFRFRLEKRLQEGEKANRQQGAESHDWSQEAGSQSRMSPVHRFSSFFGNPSGPSTPGGRSRRGTQRSESGMRPTPKSSHGVLSGEGKQPSGPSSPTDERSRPDDEAHHNKKLHRVGKLMMSGMGSHRGDGLPQGGETFDGTTGIDGHKMSTSSQAPPASARWAMLRQKLRETSVKRNSRNEPRSRVVGQMSVITELQSGILPVFMLKMALERDEQGHRRVPVLLNHLRLRVSDSVNPLHTSSAVFRIELEYGDGLIRWVCYRSLRDFINLHTHYRAAALKGYLGRSIGQTEGDIGIPKFPKTSLPYFNQLQRQGWGRNGGNVRAQFAKAQREALEDYMIELIKRTMFRPEANRLCKFFELSALSISLAARGGYQGKQGYLRILSRSSRRDNQHGVLTPLHWAMVRQPKWFLVRESYIAIVEQPDSLQVFDVFLIDSNFEIIRPKRLYKQTLHLAHELGGSDAKEKEGSKDPKDDKPETRDIHEKPAADVKDDAANPSGSTDRADETALLTEGQWKDQDDEYSGVGQHDKSNVSSHTFYIKNSERKLKLVANNERQMDQFITSMERVAQRTIFGKANRFGSFAPIRLNCNAQWLVDGRDYMWQVSRALMRAKDRIFIHDWWLSPEVYLRRPGIPKYRLDHILKKKASEGVKIFVIVYNEVSNNFTPTDSNYTKQRLIGLHRNIFVQRSPSHFQTGTFYWAHHEKMCVIDETIAFMGGIDLCFGRWDTAAHVLGDNIHEAVTDVPKDYMSPSGVDKPEHHPALVGPGVHGHEFFVWPGQDFANERVMEWYDLTKPDIDLFNRNHYPRMPWHDVGVQLIGQPARDLCRHFTQRWNFLLRIKNHKRLMPFLIPPPDFLPSELQKYDLTGTCEAQICRSAGPWSLGTADTVEHSIQNAYLKAIQMSEHFVYIENQFFVTSTEVRGTVIENKIGDALVDRIIRAHRERTPWRAVIVIPLIPGFPLPIDHADASSVRLIVELQSRSINRGEHSIFGKLRRRGIDPADYIDFFSLRQWGKLPGGKLTTEQVYIHGKCMVADDRLAIIGSANINERSQRGDRDSELACIVRDTDMIDSTMAGQPFKVGRFAHTLRMRLMREHLGVDVDELDGQAAAADMAPERMQDEDDWWDPAHEQSRVAEDGGQSRVKKRTQADMMGRQARDTIVPMANGVGEEVKQTTSTASDRISGAEKNVHENGVHKSNGEPHGSGEEMAQSLDERIKHISEDTSYPKISGLADSKASANVPLSGMVVPTAEERHVIDLVATQGKIGAHDKDSRIRAASTASNVDVKKVMMSRMSSSPWAPSPNPPEIDADRFADPLADTFYRDMWMASAVHNTQIFRKVFKCTPDDTVTTWAEYKAFMAWSERLSRSGPAASGPAQGAQFAGNNQPDTVPNGRQGKHGSTSSSDVSADDPREADRHEPSGANPSSGHAQKHSAGLPGSVTNKLKQPQQQILPHNLASAGYEKSGADDEAKGDDKAAIGLSSTMQNGSAPQHPNEPFSSQRKDGFSPEELEQMERLLETTRGTLVLHSLRFLEAEERSDNLLFNLDRLNPLNVYS